MLNNLLPSYFFDLKINSKTKILKKAKFAWEILDNLKLSKKTIVGKKTVIDPTSVIEDSVVIGENCVIRPHVYIRSGTVIGNNVVIDHGAEIKNSLISDECKIGSLSFVGDSVLGYAVRIGSAAMTANRRFDQKEISIKIKEKKILTKFDKFGCIIGDYSRLGANCTTAPGTLIGRHVWIYPGVFVHGFIESNKLVKLKQEIEITEKEPVILKRTDKNNNI
jgi:UDP-N-acetylglucosamine diphosphorylase / glucose-1-phosphate thymidylyltransferase / UDP-N-acetylgalactosamine diphosphorylase / glucosamine-1-phosphate N-acetyltransferase / galactosamine-1-phosphate N-acetyltransferase